MGEFIANTKPQQYADDIEPLNKILEMNILTQDEQQMVNIVKRHYFENGLITHQLSRQIALVSRNMQSVQILCQGDAAYEQDLTSKVKSAKKVLKGLQDRIAPLKDLQAKLAQMKRDYEKLTGDQQNEELALRRINHKIEEAEAERDKEQKEVEKLNESMKFKEAVHQHLKKNLVSCKQMITRLKTTSEELSKQLTTDSQNFKLEQQRKQQQIDKLTNTAGRLRQQKTQILKSLDAENAKFNSQIEDWRERTRGATQRRNDVADTFQKGSMEAKLLQAQMTRHLEKHKLAKKRAQEAHAELQKTKSEIESTKEKIAEYASVPEAHKAAIKQLREDNLKLHTEIDQLTKDEKEAREQVNVLRYEFNELQSLDAASRRQKIEHQQRSLREALEKIDGAVTAAESSYTCFECLKPVKNPMTFVPCGHSVCKHHNKHTDDMLICPECKMQCETVFANNTIPDLLSKLQFLHSLISTAIEN